MSDSINFFGKVATFPRPIKPSVAYKYLESLKIDRERLWYVLIQQQSDSLTMIKYNAHAGVSLDGFVAELLEFYRTEYPDVSESMKSVTVEAGADHAVIKNIPAVSMGGRPAVAVFVSDLITLLRDPSASQS